MQVIRADMTCLGYISPYNLHTTYITNIIEKKCEERKPNTFYSSQYSIWP